MTKTEEENRTKPDPTARAADASPEQAGESQSLEGKTTRGDRERVMELLRERHTHGAISFDAMMRESHRIVPPDHKTHQHLQSNLEQAAEILGLDRSHVKLVIFARYPSQRPETISFELSRVNAYLPEAFVNPVTGTVYLNTALLEVLKYDPQKINGVMYHELAHLVLTRGIMEELAQSMSDPLGMSLRDYDVEYHCDRVAALISSKRGEDPRSIGQALEATESAERELLSRTRADLTKTPPIDLPLLSSHPATARRIRANERLSHQLPVPSVGATSAPPLDVIDTSTLPITRPYGQLHKIKNEFGNTADSLATGDRFRGGSCPVKIFLRGDDYRAWCGPLKKPRDSEVLPCTIQELLEDPSPYRVSDWLREFADLADQRTETLADVVDEFLKELESISLENVTMILERIHPSRIIENYDEPSQTAFQDSPLPFCLSPLVNRYLELKSEQGASSLDSLKALVDMGRKQELMFGTSIIFSAREVGALTLDICQNGSESERKELVEIISKHEALTAALVLTGSTLKVAISALQSQTSEALEPLIQKYSPFKIEKEENKLSNYSMCVDIIPLSRDNAIEQPTVLRRVPGAEFAVEILHRPGGAVPIMMIQIGDKPLSGENIESIREAFLNRFTDRFQIKLHSQDISNTLDNILESIATQAPKLLRLSVPAREEIEAFMTTQLAAEYAQSVTTTSEAKRVGRELYQTKLRELFVATSIERQIIDTGDDETTLAWIGPDRSTYSTTSYTRAESSSFELFQATLLFTDLHRSTFDAMTPSASKAEFLLTNFPLKVLEHDQLLCEALGYPALDCLNDMAMVEQRMAAETDIKVLHIMRDGLKNQGLAQVAEARLYALGAEDRTAFLTHPTMVTLRPAILASLPETVQGIAAQDEKLLSILSAFTQPSRQRDKHLTEFIDHANSRSLKEGLGSLLVDPIVSQVSPNIDRDSRVSLDTALSLLKHLAPYDKAQALLYFMGARAFESPTATWLLDGHDTTTTITGLQKELTLRAPKGKFIDHQWTSKLGSSRLRIRHSFELPDCLVRAQKAFGISIATAENLQASVLNERAITDLLTTILYGDSGIVHDTKVRKEFFLLAGRTLVETSERLQTLEPERRKALAKFVAFAFEQCPPEKLPTVIMRVWEATKGDAEQLPAVLASVLTGLGPAFVKFGQKLATLNIDADYKKACRQLSSENKEVDSTLFYHNTEALFGGPTFDPERSGRKLGEGSMAATFKALFEGEREPMAIKIIQPSIEREIESDCAYIHKLVEYINTHKPFDSLTLPKNTANVIRYQLQQQIDTKREIANSKALSVALRPTTEKVNFRVATIHERLSPRGVIAAEFLPGYELDKPEIELQGHSSVAIRNEVGLETLRLLLTAPVYQSDVNLGNFGVLTNPATGEIVTTDRRPTVVWYDAGAVEEISSEDQKLLLTIIKSAMTDPSSLPKQLSKLVKNAEEGGPTLARICEELKEEWTGRGSFAPSVIKERFERFFDKVSEAGLEIEERWLIVANTISMAAPLLEGVPSDRLRELVVDALKHHKMLSITERAALKAASWFS